LFVREAVFSFRILYTNVPSRVLRLLAIEVILQGKRAHGMRISLHWGAWQGPSLPETYV
jgi:hypothetical protein